MKRSSDGNVSSAASRARKGSKRRAIQRVELRVPEFSVDFSALPDEDPPSLTQSILQNDIPRELHHVAIEKYHYFRTNYRQVCPSLGGNFVIRQPQGIDPVNIDAIHDALHRVLKSLRPFGARINVSFAVFLENEEIEDPEQRYSLVYASSNNFQLFKQAAFVTNKEEKEDLFSRVSYESVNQHLDLLRDSTKVRIQGIGAVLINAVVLSDAFLDQ